MLRRLRLRNFKMHEDTQLELGAVNVLIGAQGTGKSSILHALAALRASSGKEGLTFRGPLKGLAFQDVVHRREERRLLMFGLELDCLGAPAFLSETGEFSVRYEITFDNQGFREHTGSFAVGNEALEFRTVDVAGGPQSSMPPAWEVAGRASVQFQASTYTLIPFRCSVEGPDYSLRRGMDDLRFSVSTFLRRSHLVPEWRIVRDATYRAVDVPDGAPTSLEQVVSKLAHEWELRDEVSERLERIVGRRINFRPAGDGIEVEAGGRVPLPVTAEGGGLRSLIWPLAAMAMAGPDSLVAIEEPEIHLHPKALADLGAAMVSAAMDKGVQFLLTTHDEHLLFALLLAVAEGRVPPEKLAIYSVGEEAGRSVVTRLPVDEKGSVEGGLTGFFEASVGELGAHVRALLSGGDSP